MAKHRVPYRCADGQTDMTAFVYHAASITRTVPAVINTTQRAGQVWSPGDEWMPEKNSGGAEFVIIRCPTHAFEEFPTPSHVAKNPDFFPAFPGPILGRPLSDKEIDAWQTWRKRVDQDEGLTRLGKYAAWLLGGSGLLLILVAGSSTAAGWPMTNLTWPAKLVFGLAITLLGLTFALTTMAIAPRWLRFVPDSEDSIGRAFDAQFASRRNWFTAASIAFATALVFAGLVRVINDTKRRPAQTAQGTQLRYTVSDNGTLDATLIARDLPPRQPIELWTVLDPPNDSVTLPRVARVTSDTGYDSLALTLNTGRLKGDLLLVSRTPETRALRPAPTARSGDTSRRAVARARDTIVQRENLWRIPLRRRVPTVDSGTARP